MRVKRERPVNLDLTSLTYPPMAIASILHRISGIALFLLLPFILYFFSLSMQSPYTYTRWQILFGQTWVKLGLWIFGSALLYHLVAGVRHIIMDVGVGEGLVVARRSALVAIVVAAVLSLIFGVWLWV